MSHLSIGHHDQLTLAYLVESVASPLLIRHPAPICLEVDMDPRLPLPVDAPSMARLLESLFQQSLDEMPDGGDLTVTACQMEATLEIEVADTGRDVAQRAQTRPMVAAALSATLAWQNCPQGGGAATITIPTASSSIHQPSDVSSEGAHRASRRAA